MNPKTFQNTRSSEIYSALRNTKLLPNISVNYDSINYQLSTPYKIRSKSNQNSSSLILYDFETTLKKQIQQTKFKEQLKNQRRRRRTLQAMHLEQRKSRQIESTISEQLESIKYSLKSLSMLKQSEIQKKQKMILLKNHMDNQNTQPAHMQYPQHLMPYYNPMAMQNPCNLYNNPYNNYHSPYNNQYSYSQPYQQKVSQSHNNIAESLKHAHSPYAKFNRNKTPKKPAPPSNLNISKQPSRYSTISQTIPISTTIPIKPKQKKQFNRSQFKKRLNDMQKYNNLQNNMKKMQKCFLAKMALKIVNQRKKFFTQFWPTEFMKFNQTFKDYFYTSFFPFFKLLKQRQFTKLLPQEDDSKLVKIQKKKTFKELLKILFTCLKPIKDIDNLGKVAWGFCSNGAFVQKGVLTKNELDFLCINQVNGSLLMDDNLQKSQIITFVLLKLIIFKFILNADKKWPHEFSKQKNIILSQNIKLLASYLYEICIKVQEEYLNKVNTKQFPIGNYQQLRQKNKSINLQPSPPLLYQTTKPEDEIISGLYSQEFLKENVRIKNTEPYVQVVKQVVEGLHKFMKEYDGKFRLRVKKMPVRPQYKY